jgi:hypothetical protein
MESRLFAWLNKGNWKLRYVLSGAAPFANNQLPSICLGGWELRFSANFVECENATYINPSISWNKAVTNYSWRMLCCFNYGSYSSGWATNNNYTIRYNIADALNCGGTCAETQTGAATATITVGPSPVFMYIYFFFWVETQSADYERITF